MLYPEHPKGPVRMRRSRRIILVAALLAASASATGCQIETPQPALSEVVGNMTFVATSYQSAVRYGSLAHQDAVVYLSSAPKKLGVIVYFPGGGFVGVDPHGASTDPYVRRALWRGYDVMSVRYATTGRTMAQVNAGPPSNPVFVQATLDASTAIGYAQTSPLFANHSNIVAVGWSAGGGLAALEASMGGDRGWNLPNKVLAFAGVLDCRGDSEFTWQSCQELTGQRVSALGTVASYLDDSDPPMYVVQSPDDPIIDPVVAQRVFDHATQVGASVTLDRTDGYLTGEPMVGCGHGPQACANATEIDAFTG